MRPRVCVSFTIGCRYLVVLRADLQVWQIFLVSFNVVTFWRNDLKLEAELVTSDEAGSSGFGVYFRGHWGVEDWPNDWVQEGWVTDLTFLVFSYHCGSAHLSTVFGQSHHAFLVR